MAWVTMIFFLCHDAGSAEEAARMLPLRPGELPEQCRWTVERLGTIDEVVSEVRLEDGRLAVIGRIRMADGRKGYSAGIMPEIF